MENTKICKKCGRELPLDCFGGHKKMKDGLQPYCKECQKQYFKQWKAEHAEDRKQYDKQYYAEHSEARKQYFKQYFKQYYADNAEAKKQYMKQYYATIEGYARQIRINNLIADRKYGRIAADEDPLPSLEYYIWALQQPDFYDGEQYHWSEMGLDRIDNSKPHTLDNVVPCSTKNNKRRQKMNFEEFCEIIQKR